MLTRQDNKKKTYESQKILGQLFELVTTYFGLQSQTRADEVRSDQIPISALETSKA